jgi:hypothetical protein
MLSYVMPIGNEGQKFDLTLAALAPVLAEGDELIVCDGGSTDQSLERAVQLGERAAVRLIRLERAVDSLTALQIAWRESDAPYLMALQPTDRLLAEPLAQLRARLAAETPDLAVLDSGWWLSDPQLPFPREDRARVAALTERPTVQDLRGLCPDLGRLVLSRTALQVRFKSPLLESSPAGRYAALLEAAETVIFQNGPVVLRALGSGAFETVLGEAARLLAPLRGTAQAERLQEIRCWLDEAVRFAPPSQAEELMASARELERALSRRLRRDVRGHPGACGRLIAALHRGGRAEAMALLALLAAEQSHLRSEHLARIYTRLRQDLDLALPGPDYLMELYSRVRSL